MTAVERWVREWVTRLNEDERARRLEVNAKHRVEFGRNLYDAEVEPQYATFTLGRPGRKFTRVEMTAHGQTSVHAFVDLATGDVFKAAGWKAPAKGARYNLLDDDSRARMFQRLEWTGAYLYADRAAAA